MLIKALIICVCTSFTTIKSDKIMKATANFEDVKKLKNDSNTLLIDVRQPEELKEHGIIPGSINIPLNDVESSLKNLSADDFKSKYGREKPINDFPIVFTCRSGRRSGIAQDTALQLGYKNVRNYSGGWLDWQPKIKEPK